jgi:hypothetical protein
MPRTCAVCLHADQVEIDRAIAGGELLSRVAREFSVSEDSLSRHRARHVPQLLVKAQAAQQASDDLLEMVRDLHIKAHELLGEARTAGKYGPAASAIREATRCVELLARLKGELESERVTMNVFLMPEWQVLRGTVDRAAAVSGGEAIGLSGAKGTRDPTRDPLISYLGRWQHERLVTA